MNPIVRYARWIHTRWPAATVEKLPEVRADGSTSVPGLFIAGDLAGVPLLKFALDGGARVARAIAADPALRADPAPPDTLDLVIVGAGVAGLAAALEAQAHGLAFEVVEAAELFFTIANFPRAKPIFAYPHAMKPAGRLQVRATVKEELLRELRGQVEAAGVRPRPGRAERVERAGGRLVVRLADGSALAARRVIVAIGRAGDFRRLGVPGEDLGQVFNRLHDPRDFAGRRVLVVGGGDSAVEAAVALTRAGADVTLCHRGRELSRPKPANLAMLDAVRPDPLAGAAVEHPVAGRATGAAGAFEPAPHPPGRLTLRLATEVREIHMGQVTLAAEGRPETLASDAVFVMIGREPPLDLLRRSGVRIANEMTPARWTALALFLLFCAWLYDWKSGGAFDALWRAHGWFPYSLPGLVQSLGGNIARAAADPRTLTGTLAISAAGPSFWYTLAYSLVVTVFGVRRIRRRRTAYVTAQTLTLMAVQVLPLFLLPELILPLLGHNGWLPRGLADALFPAAAYGHGREYWRAYGFVLAWPLDVYNVFTQRPLPWWLAIAFLQTFVLIPLAVWRYGKGAYCGWICSCGALAETLGDTHRHRMPHGPRWNRLNLAGQGVLAVAGVLLLLRVAGWLLPAGNAADAAFEPLKNGYKWTVDVFLAGVLGYGFYFWFSGRVWCRFFCPLAALMHVYARFSRFRIAADKQRCISCGQCTAQCHQGIDVMSFANRGLPMADPECVRCSACVHACPTGVLSFGRVDRAGSFIALDRLSASPVREVEGTRPAPGR